MKNKRLLALLLCVITVIVSLPCTAITLFAEDEPTTIITASDFQPKEGASAGILKVRKILYAMQRDGISKADGFLFCGDYDFSTYGVVEETKEGIRFLTNAMKSTVDTENMVFLQGNHDAVSGTAGLAQSGNNDPKNGKYGVYVINQDDYMWYNSDETRIKKTTQRLIDYLNEKLMYGYDKPIFVMSHLPLHYSMRTRLEGDAKYANYIFDALNEAGAKGLNIIFLYGHDHANGWDDYLGGSSVYLAKGDTIQIAQRNQNIFKKQTLNFTYMNAGYVGYYDNHNGADDALTMSYISIATDGTVTVKRYDEKGVHNLKAEGKTNSYKNESGYQPDTKVYTSPQTITPTKITDKTPIKDIMELNEGGRTYKRINSVSELRDGGSYLLVYNASTDKILVPKVVEKSNADGTRIGFELEKTFDFGENTAYGDQGSKEWTFHESDNGWKLSYEGKFIKLTNTSDKKITATLEDEGNIFKIAGESAYTFTSGSYMFNYNARDLMNAFTSDPASFYIYEYVGYSINIVNGTATIGGEEITAADVGDTVTIKAKTAPDGYSFDRWVVNGDVTLSDETSQEATFTMPEAALKISATYKEKSGNETPVDTKVPNQTEESTPTPTPTPPAENNSGITVYIIVGVFVLLFAVVLIIIRYRRHKWI